MALFLESRNVQLKLTQSVNLLPAGFRTTRPIRQRGRMPRSVYIMLALTSAVLWRSSIAFLGPTNIIRAAGRPSSRRVGATHGLFTRTRPYSRIRPLSSSADTLITLEDGIHEDEQTIKKSRFIGLAMSCDNWEEAQEFVTLVKADHPKARHVCFGWVAGQDPVKERASDDGEPTGTAGSPILNAIKGEGLSDIVCAVVRYSGGIKLGAGGLIRAYGGSARLSLRVGPKKVLVPKSTVMVKVPVASVGSIYSLVEKLGGTAGEEIYDEGGNLQVTLTVETRLIDDVQQQITDGTRGEAEFIKQGII